MSRIAPDNWREEHAHGPVYASPGLAARYWRPGYSSDGIEWALTQLPDADVVELGAGTGILSRALAQRSRSLLATDKSSDMTAELSKELSRFRNATARVGAAEEIPVPARSADAVMCAQSLHFFNSKEVAAEARRVTRPGGRFVAVWHMADRTQDWVNELWEIFGNRLHGDHLAATAAELAKRFDHQAMALFANPQRMGCEDFVSLSHTGDRWTLGDPEQRNASDAEVRAVYERHHRNRQTVELPYPTAVWMFSDKPIPDPESPSLLPRGEAERVLRAYTGYEQPTKLSRFYSEGALRGREEPASPATRPKPRARHSRTHAQDRPGRPTDRARQPVGFDGRRTSGPGVRYVR